MPTPFSYSIINNHNSPTQLLLDLPLLQPSEQLKSSIDAMAGVKRISSFIADQLSLVVFRRGFASVSGTSVVRGSGVAIMKKGGEESKKSIPWIPDPVTGYYRPEGQAKEIDAAELREILLKQNNRRN